VIIAETACFIILTAVGWGERHVVVNAVHIESISEVGSISYLRMISDGEDSTIKVGHSAQDILNIINKTCTKESK